MVEVLVTGERTFEEVGWVVVVRVRRTRSEEELLIEFFPEIYFIHLLFSEILGISICIPINHSDNNIKNVF